MGVEIERKFLVTRQHLPELPLGKMILQGYVSTRPTVRVRVEEAVGGPRGYVTLKGKGTIERLEFEYPVPVNDAREMLAQLCSIRIEKVRYEIKGDDGHTWEVDRFVGAHAGLWLAEIELSEVNEAFERPLWLGREVSDDPRYTNVSLAEMGRAP